MDHFQLYFAKAIQVVKLNKLVINEMLSDKKAFKYALWILILPNFIDLFLSSLAYRSINMTIVYLMLILLLVDVFLLFFLPFVASNLFKAKKKYKSFFTLGALTYVLNWILIIPFILALIGFPAMDFLALIFFAVGIWKLVVLYNLLKIVYSFKPFKAALQIAIFIIADAAIKGFFVEKFLGEDYKEVLSGVLS